MRLWFVGDIWRYTDVFSLTDRYFLKLQAEKQSGPFFSHPVCVEHTCSRHSVIHGFKNFAEDYASQLRVGSRLPEI